MASAATPDTGDTGQSSIQERALMTKYALRKLATKVYYTNLDQGTILVIMFIICTMLHYTLVSYNWLVAAVHYIILHGHSLCSGRPLPSSLADLYQYWIGADIAFAFWGVTIEKQQFAVALVWATDKIINIWFPPIVWLVAFGTFYYLLNVLVPDALARRQVTNASTRLLQQAKDIRSQQDLSLTKARCRDAIWHVAQEICCNPFHALKMRTPGAFPPDHLDLPDAPENERRSVPEFRVANLCPGFLTPDQLANPKDYADPEAELEDDEELSRARLLKDDHGVTWSAIEEQFTALRAMTKQLLGFAPKPADMVPLRAFEATCVCGQKNGLLALGVITQCEFNKMEWRTHFALFPAPECIGHDAITEDAVFIMQDALDQYCLDGEIQKRYLLGNTEDGDGKGVEHAITALSPLT